MIMILTLFFIFFSIGLYFILLDVLKVPTLKTKKAITQVVVRDRKSNKNLDTFILDLSIKLSKYIKFSDYKKKQFESTLKSAEINIPIELYLSKAIIKSALVLVFVIPCLLILPLLAPVLVFLAIAIFFKEYNMAFDIVKKKSEVIEIELPRFVNTVAQELQSSRDILKILETYQRHAGKVFKSELEVTIADMKSGSLETALDRLDQRMKSRSLSEVITGLKGVIRGDNNVVHFQMLAINLKALEIQRLKKIAMKRPSKIKKYSFAMLSCFLIMYLAIIGYEIFNAFTKMI